MKRVHTALVGLHDHRVLIAQLPRRERETTAASTKIDGERTLCVHRWLTHNQCCEACRERHHHWSSHGGLKLLLSRLPAPLAADVANVRMSVG